MRFGFESILEIDIRRLNFLMEQEFAPSGIFWYSLEQLLSYLPARSRGNRVTDWFRWMTRDVYPHFSQVFAVVGGGNQRCRARLWIRPPSFSPQVVVWRMTYYEMHIPGSKFGPLSRSFVHFLDLPVLYQFPSIAFMCRNCSMRVDVKMGLEPRLMLEMTNNNII